MAYVLSLPSTNPLERPFANPLCMRSCSSFTSQASLGTVRHHTPRSVSAASARSALSTPNGLRSRHDENSHPRLASRSLFSLIHDLNNATPPGPSSGQVSRQASWGSSRSASPVPTPGELRMLKRKIARLRVSRTTQESADTPRGSVSDDALDVESPHEAMETTIAVNIVEQINVPVGDEPLELEELEDHQEEVEEEDAAKKIPEQLPFKRWLSTLRRKNQQRHQDVLSHLQSPAFDEAYRLPPLESPRQHSARHAGHRQSLSLTSSIGLLTAVKSASMTWTATSLATKSRVDTRSARLRGDNRSSRFSDVRMSFESTAPSVENAIDEKAWARSVQRRKIVEELLYSEENYIVDMKALVNVYFTVLATMPTMTLQRRKNIQKSVTQIVQLHEELLAELHKMVPNSEATEDDIMPRPQRRKAKHFRWHSAESVPSRPNLRAMGHRVRHSIDASRPAILQVGGVIVNTSIVLNVAKVFDRFMSRFLTYEAYAANNEVMEEDASSTSRLIPTWPAYERGVEALASSTNSIYHHEARNRKGLTFSDLLIKASVQIPIQRICKYPLFFQDLAKHTPACDDPVAHAELQKVLFRLQETANEINTARDNPLVRKLIETTWILQDRLVFKQIKNDGEVPVQRLLGHVVLCGVLHVAYDTHNGIKGDYMISILYRSSLVLALVNKNLATYDVFAVMSLNNARLDDSDNGRGLQCHTAPHTWKFIFESNQRQYEVIMSACSEEEEEQWKAQIRTRIETENRNVVDGLATPFVLLPTDLRSLGPAFEANGSFTRRKSIHRAATLGTKTNLHQVIIKNTHAQKPGNNDSESSLPVLRSQSHMSSGHVPTLAPRRAERIRLETVLSEVWSRDVLPYPGMVSRRPDNPIRASANSVMRKLSMASIASNFSKRSASFASFSHHRLNETSIIPPNPLPPLPCTRPKRTLVKRPCPNSGPLVDFHSAPTAFLPEDFELNPPSLDGRRRRRANRAATSERSMTGRPMTPIRMFMEKSQETTKVSRVSTIIESPPARQLSPSETRTGASIATVVHTPVKGDSRAHHTPIKGPTKARSILFKLLGVTKD
ncbi:hypothetical protein EG328_007431 [Venturia inaequalis]|uniref:DH domain-containing protein n=1 Tax=Venturia inaequalis TaxID=5025 RepID=A0A8H3ZD13_VENIN|nr:hypothetical protein EG328_007431 [Venturia inaequalis]